MVVLLGGSPMRRLLLVLALVLLSPAASQAEKEPIPIEVAPRLGVEVTDAQLAWVRTWLKDHLHPADLVVLEVDIDNRTHPGSLVAAEARLPAKEVDTYHIQRVIRIGHESWDVFGDAYGFEGGVTTGPWRVLDTYRVKRVFPLGKTRKNLQLADDLSYAEVHALLQALHAKAVRLTPKTTGTALPKMQDISAISREDGRYRVWTTDPDDDLSGSWLDGTLEEGHFVIHESGGWIS